MKKILLYILFLSFITASVEEKTQPKIFIIKEEKTGTLIMGTQSKEKEDIEKNTPFYTPHIILPIKNTKPPRPPEPRSTQNPSQK
ncbi:MAG: hypothetical protein ACRCV3_02460 [Desulfovibrionaceae bacterium]